MAAGGEPEMVIDYQQAKSISTEILHNNEELSEMVNSVCIGTIYSIYLEIYCSKDIYNVFFEFTDGINESGIEKLTNLIDIINKRRSSTIEIPKDIIKSGIREYFSAYNELVELYFERSGNRDINYLGLTNNWRIEYNPRLKVIENFYRNFFSLYLKGGKAMRYLVEYMNSFIEGDNKLDVSVLGKNSDYDFNFVINPYMPPILFDRLFEINQSIFYNLFNYILFSEDIFKKESIFANNLLRKLNEKIPEVNFDTRHSMNDLDGEKISIVDKEVIGSIQVVDRIKEMVLPFKLIRLLTSLYSRGIQKIVAGELIDISMIKKEVNGIVNNEIYVDIEHSNHLINITNRDILGIRDEPLAGFNPLNCYALSTILEDLEVTIKESIDRGDFSKVEKRKKRLNFFEEILCLNQLAIQITGLNKEMFEELRGDRCKKILSDLYCGNLFTKEQLNFIKTISIGKKVEDIFDIFNLVLKSIYSTSLTYNLLSKNMDGIQDYQQVYSVFNMEAQQSIFLSLDEIIGRIKSGISDVNIETREIIKKLFCFLTNDLVNLWFSFNDQFMMISIFYQYLEFLGSIFEILGNGMLENFKYSYIQHLINNIDMNISDLYDERNYKYSVPFIRLFSKYIINTLFEKIINTGIPEFILNIRGGLAFNLQLIGRQIGDNLEFSRLLTENIKSPIENLLTNDIDFELYLKEQTPEQLFIIQTNIKEWLIDICNELNGTELISNLYLQPVIIGDTLQIVSVIEGSDKPDFQWNGNSISNGYVQHPLEINIINTSEENFYEKFNEVTIIERKENRILSIENPISLIENFDKVLREDRHPIRKEKYLYRIQFLTNNNLTLDKYNFFMKMISSGFNELES